MSYTNTYSEIYHHGVKGQKWGVRNYQNPDGSLTPLGRQHYGYSASTKSQDEISTKEKKKTLKKLNKYNKRLEAIQYEQKLYETNDEYKKALYDYRIDRAELQTELKTKEKEYNKLINDILSEHGNRILTKKALRKYSIDVSDGNWHSTVEAKERLGKRYVDKTLSAIENAKTDMGNSKIDAISRIAGATGTISAAAGAMILINPLLTAGGIGLITAAGMVEAINSKGVTETFNLPSAQLTVGARTEEYYDKQ